MNSFRLLSKHRVRHCPRGCDITMFATPTKYKIARSIELAFRGQRKRVLRPRDLISTHMPASDKGLRSEIENYQLIKK